MVETLERIAASLLCATLFCVITVKMLGAMQQSGYKGGTFLRWLSQKENMLFNRLCVLALCLALASAITALCFSFLGLKTALLISAVPFTALLFLYLYADSKRALKVPLVKTGRVKRLFVCYFFFTLCLCYAYIAFLGFLSAWNGSLLYGLIAYVPFALLVPCLPFVLTFSGLVMGVFENARNKKFVKRAGQVLDETKITRVAIVGSYGKTSVKNILSTLLLEKYKVIATPESYNTPLGIAKTVTSAPFTQSEIFIAEMGARKTGDIRELCELVKPDCAIFTGVCAQHIRSFGSEENVLLEKSEILSAAKLVVCGETLKEKLGAKENALFVGLSNVQDLELLQTETRFTLRLGEEKIRVSTRLLGKSAAENIALAAALAHEYFKMSAEEIARGIAKIEQIPHRLQLLESGGAYILDDGYNCNLVGAKTALEALARFEKGKCVVTPGIVECGVLEEEINGELGAAIAGSGADKIILVGETLVGAVKTGYLQAGGASEKLCLVKDLEAAKVELAGWLGAGDCVLFLNDLPDVI